MVKDVSLFKTNVFFLKQQNIMHVKKFFSANNSFDGAVAVVCFRDVKFVFFPNSNYICKIRIAYGRVSLL